MTRTGLVIRNYIIPGLVILCVACAPRAAAPKPSSAVMPGGPQYDQAAPLEKAVVMEEAAAPPAPMQSGAFGGSESAPAEKRIVIRTVDMSLVVKDPVKSMDEIGKMAEDLGGFVVTSNRFQHMLESGVEVPEGTITIRVPAERLNETLEKLKADAVKVQHENVSGQDVTQEYTDQKSRLKNLEAAETDLRKIMDNAYTTEDIMSVYNQLIQVREQIEVVKGQIQYYEQSSALSAITIQLVAEASVEPVTVGGWQPVGIARDAIQALINALKFLANVVIWLILFFLPIAILIYIPIRLLWALIRRLRSKSKKSKDKSAPTSVQASQDAQASSENKKE